MNFRKTSLYVGVFLIAGLFLSGCFKGNGNDKQNQAQKKMSKKTGQLQMQAVRQVDVPEIENFRERKLVKWIYELRDREDLTTYTYLRFENNDKLTYYGETVGFGIPYGVQFSNPQRKAHQEYGQGGSFGKMPQPEPNGLYPPSNVDATWVLKKDQNGELTPEYVEPAITVTRTKLPRRLVDESTLPEDY